jgi:tetratricopeptide (TPR) repeat protein
MKATIQYLLLATIFTATSGVKVSAHGGFDEEIKLTDNLIAASPNDGQHWYHRAYLNFLHGDWQITLSDSEKAERLAPGKFPVDWLRAQALAAGNQLDVALTVINDFVNAHPGHPGGLVVRARILNKLKRSELALVDFREALA